MIEVGTRNLYRICNHLFLIKKESGVKMTKISFNKSGGQYISILYIILCTLVYAEIFPIFLTNWRVTVYDKVPRLRNKPALHTLHSRAQYKEAKETVLPHSQRNKAVPTLCVSLWAKEHYSKICDKSKSILESITFEEYSSHRQNKIQT